MPLFKDELNRSWEVGITILDVRKLRDHAKIDIMDSDSLSELFDSEELQYEAVWYLVETQAKTYGVDEIAFAKVFTTHYAAASAALVEAVKLFFQSTGRTETVTLIEKILLASQRLRGVASKNLNSDRFEQVLTKLVTDEEERINKAMDRALDPSTTTASSGD
jgi:hypothetical protein